MFDSRLYMLANEEIQGERPDRETDWFDTIFS